MNKRTFDRKVIKDDKQRRIEKARRDNRANQLNPQHPAYWLSRGYVFVDEEDDCDDRLYGPV